MGKKGDENYFKLPKPILKKGGCNLSFAGLKTAVLKISKELKNEKEKYNLAASFQKTINEILYEKLKLLWIFFENKKIKKYFCNRRRSGFKYENKRKFN